ncbi:AAA family ATPase [Streptomyces apricus]|uniref:MoxR family ATPase n=1 Tax=Streptomyces apricus TaxID=1828112 RepID=A0A5B0BNQ2_9ACTN|nr:MoxR family ATPase [Streptomyces apricus]KAA0942405.1 MoxR family ATPase [Streptomyces apricus]
MNETTTERLFKGDGVGYPDDVPLPEPPPWRRPSGRRDRTRYLIRQEQIDVINAALRLRRPLLVTGRPGTGKSTLARAIADELGLGPVLTWPVNTRSTLDGALYRYDAIGRLRDQQGTGRGVSETATQDTDLDIGVYIRLGALGTALATDHRGRPRMLLIDEFDKSDVDLPNDLLFVLEEGEFQVPELARLPEDRWTVQVNTADWGERVTVHGGTVRCEDFPFVLITSNGEREFPPAFLRRCVRLELPYPDEEQLEKIVRAHFTDDHDWERVRELIRRFVEQRELGDLATDQLLHAVHLMRQGIEPGQRHLKEAVLRELRDTGS